MTDLVERLRDDPRPHEWKNGLGPASMEAWHKTCLEAADRIEDLERTVEEQNYAINMRDWRFEALEAENKRLRAALQEVWDCEADVSCPNCKLIARQALAAVEERDDE